MHAQSTNPSRPNIILITTDQQFADAMSFRMGKRWIHTPNMDKLAEEGMFFTRSYAENPLCVPSRNSIVTGLYSHTTGIEANNDLARDGVKNPKSMGTYFKDAGYETAYFGKWHLNYNTKDKSAHGFETVETFSKRINDDTLPTAVNEFLKKNYHKPLLLWVSFVNPHDIC